MTSGQGIDCARNEKGILNDPGQKLSSDEFVLGPCVGTGTEWYRTQHHEDAKPLPDPKVGDDEPYMLKHLSLTLTLGLRYNSSHESLRAVED